MSASKRAQLLHSLPLSENASRTCLLGAGRRQLESSSYGPDCLHFESFKVDLDLVQTMPETLTKSRFECICRRLSTVLKKKGFCALRNYCEPRINMC